MKKILSIIAKSLAWIALIMSFAALGFSTDNPGLMVPVYAGIFIVILGFILFRVSKHKRHSFDDIKTPVAVKYVLMPVLVIASLILPAFFIMRYRPGLLTFTPIFIFTLIMLALGIFGVWLINCYSKNNKMFAYVGYVVLVITSAIPAFAIAGLDSSYGMLGLLYYVTIIEAIVAWSGFSMLTKVLINKDE